MHCLLHLELKVRLLYPLANYLETLRGNQERLFHFYLFAVHINWKGIVLDLILLVSQILLKMFVVLSSKWYYYSCFSLLLCLFLDLVVVLLIY
jgi:hypothetical protein